MRASDIKALTEQFKDGYYCDEDAIKEAVSSKGMFNIIDHKSSYKADFVILKDHPYRITEFERREQVDFLDMSIFIVSKEDLLLSKLIWIQDIQSAIQMEDIRSLSQVSGLDWTYIQDWISKMKLNTFGLLNI